MNVESKEDKKCRVEEGWANILLRHLNSTGCDYVIGEQHQLDGWGDVDVFAKSDSNKYSPLYIQLCLDVNPKSPGFEKILKRSRMFTGFGRTLEAIKAKAEKYKESHLDFSQITLAIQTYYLTEHDTVYSVPELRNQCKQFGFKAIYVLSPKGQFVDGKKDPERVFQLL